ncbi:branched-chain amino acid ABC transporter permease [Georgenia sp. 10Sc9-8]|uniref:Branched-chain amino acid ABC transporter permease n=1 Tax=Georgenia halotolerans TaxID=3028317 RepID=A0ABT5U3G3_9MICO|nr:branched-chain amino acid ABC transporter permease [Georgenia halotolerans]
MDSMILFLVGVLTLGGFYAILALILNMVAGWGGMSDLGVAGLVAVGAYTYVIVTQTAVPADDILIAPGLPIWLGVVAAGLATAAVALLIGMPTLRLRGEYFLITTLAFAEVIRQVALNATPLTRGTVGFTQIERPFSDLLTGQQYRFALLAMVLGLVLLLFWLTRQVSSSPFGRVLRAIRDNEPVAVSLGKHVAAQRIAVYVFGGLLIGLVAPLYIWHIRTTVPNLFMSEMTFTVWTALVVGGIGSRVGPVVGGFVLILVTELFTFLQGSAENAQILAATRPILLGLVLILAMRFRPQGLVTERSAFRHASSRTAAPETFRDDKEVVTS